MKILLSPVYYVLEIRYRKANCLLGNKKMDLKQALGVLSKSSPYAVSTERSGLASELDELKKYLYIETQIEKDFKNAIEHLTEQKIVFLCGSSGDGKSEIMTRYSQQTQFSHIDFHLDATHSYDPKLDAIATLDRTFTEHSTSDRPLVVGINLGMMSNYAKEGADEHNDIKKAMQLNIDTGESEQNIHFLSFEEHKYAKFCFKGGKPQSEFASKFMQKLTRESLPAQPNPFCDLMLKSKKSKQELKIVANFNLLSINSVQETIIELLMKARLAKDQFLTARAFLDFLFSLLVGEGYLFDNIFLTKNNELAEKIESFDPALIRTEKLDNLVLTLKLDLINPEFSVYKNELEQFGVADLKEPASFIRLFYVLRNAEFGNNYHAKFSNEFANRLLDDYSSVLVAHQNFKSEQDENAKSVVNNFYKHNLFTALWRYINRSAPELKSKQFLIAKENNVLFATELKLLVDWSKVAEYNSSDLMSFNALIKVNKAPIEPALPVNINLFELLLRLNLGYRPNKYDKSCVLLLDELVEQIKVEMAKSETIVIVDGNSVYEAERDGNNIEMTE